jgi:hypothetical protein
MTGDAEKQGKVPRHGGALEVLVAYLDRRSVARRFARPQPLHSRAIRRQIAPPSTAMAWSADVST